MKMKKLKIIKEEKDGSSIAFAVEPSFPLPSKMRIGVDPGTRNLGIAVIRPKLVKLYKITLERKETALDRMLDVQRVLGDTIGHFTPDSVAIIEGASYYGYRQVELAEQRAATALWFHKLGIEVHIIPPLKIRKQVFGNSKEKNPWGIEDNCAAALGAALYEQISE
jgi:hypothetical protein